MCKSSGGGGFGGGGGVEFWTKTWLKFFLTEIRSTILGSAEKKKEKGKEKKPKN